MALCEFPLIGKIINISDFRSVGENRVIAEIHANSTLGNLNHSVHFINQIDELLHHFQVGDEIEIIAELHPSLSNSGLSYDIYCGSIVFSTEIEDILREDLSFQINLPEVSKTPIASRSILKSNAVMNPDNLPY